jgi:hypothetical protein
MRGIFTLALVLAAAASAQSPTATPDNFTGVFASYSHYSVPQVSGGAVTAVEVKDSGVFSFTEYQLTSSKTKPYTVQSATTTGAAKPWKHLVLRKIPIDTFFFGNLGMAASSSTAGLAIAFGAVGVIGLDEAPVFKHFGWKGFKLLLAVQELKTTTGSQLPISFGIGKSYN